MEIFRITKDGMVESSSVLTRSAWVFAHSVVAIVAVLSLLIIQLQVCSPPLAASDFGFETVICDDDGVPIDNSASKKNKSNHQCDKCLDCLLCSPGHLGRPEQASSIGRSFAQEIGVTQSLETLLVALPDHLLPFSGAPPPPLQDQFMLHASFVPMPFASTQLRRMPEIVSWH